MTLDAEDIETSRKNTTTTTTDSPAREHVAGTDAPTAAAAAGSGAAAPDEPGVAAGDSEKRQEENHQQQQQQQQEQEETRSSTRDNTAHELPTGEPPSEAPVASTSHEDGQPAAANAVPPRYSVYGPWEKRLIVLGAALSAFFSPLTAQIYLPALPQLSEDFHVSASKMNLTVTTYMIFQGVTPMLIGGFADAAGRRPAFVLCFVIYVAANIGLALSDSFGALLGVRCLQSAGSSTTVALCQAVVADIVTSAERGQFIGITVLPVVLAPSLGPVLGGLLTEYLGWRAIFWFLAIGAGVDLLALLFFFPETCRRIVGDGSVRPPPVYRTFWQAIQDARRRRRRRRQTNQNAAADSSAAAADGGTAALARPRLSLGLSPRSLIGSLELLCQKEIGLLLFDAGLAFAGFYAISTAMPSQLRRLYGFNDVQIGLMYLPMAGGSIAAAAVVGPALNRNYRRHAARLGRPVDRTRQMDLAGFPIERARLEVGLPLLALSAALMMGWGWALEARVGGTVALPCVLLFFMGAAMIGFNNATNTLIIDIHARRAGSAVAANNLTRCLLGAAASAVIVPMIDAMGSGWAFVVLGAIYVACMPVLVLIMRKGVRWRAEEAERERRRAAKKQRKAEAKAQRRAEKKQAKEGERDEAQV